MTNHWNDIGNSDVMMIIGSNAAENHPISFKYVQQALDNGGKLIVVDPRFTRSASKASVVDDVTNPGNNIQLYSKMRSGTDIAFMLGMMKYAIDNNRLNWQYLRDCTNASFMLNSGFETCTLASTHPDGGSQTGIFSGLATDPVRHKKYNYDKSTWAYQYADPGTNDVPLTDTVFWGASNSGLVPATIATDTPHADSVWAKLIDQVSRYNLTKVSDITGADTRYLENVYDMYTSTYLDNKSACIMYAMGSTQHTYGSQNVRAYAMMQLLLGNTGVAGGGINALRGESNVQGSTDMCLLWHILPGYLGVTNTSVAKKDRAAYKYGYSYGKRVRDITPIGGVPGFTTGNQRSLSWWRFGVKYIDSLIQAWWPLEHTGDANLDTAYHYLPKADKARWYTHV